MMVEDIIIQASIIVTQQEMERCNANTRFTLIAAKAKNAERSLIQVLKERGWAIEDQPKTPPMEHKPT